MNERSKSLLIGIAGISGLFALIVVANGGGAGSFLLGFLGFLGGLIYFIPAFVAYEREHDNAAAILVLNLLLGWALIPWVIALIWAMSKSRAPEVVQQHVGLAEPAAAGTTRTCPLCAETVKAEAKLCKHCRSELPAV